MSAPTAVRWWVESWDPGYGASAEEQLPRTSKVEVALDVEVPAESWRALDARPDAPRWPTVLFVDGVRRIDAIGWLAQSLGAPQPAGMPQSLGASQSAGAPEDAGGRTMGLFASYAAGVVRCRADGARLLAADVRRGLFTGAEQVGQLLTSAGPFTGVHVPIYSGGAAPAQQLSQAVQTRMRAVEVAVSETARAAVDPGAGDLLVVDGPLHGRTHLPRTLGYVKTHSTDYLPARLHRMAGELLPGQRTPVFQLVDSWRRYSWYVKLPGPPAAWAGVVRVECSAEVPVLEAVELATASQSMLGRYASTEYKDARAPQNLYPIAGLERELRRRLGDRALLYRAIRGAAV